jgi:hypothetical protein
VIWDQGSGKAPGFFAKPGAFLRHVVTPRAFQARDAATHAISI